MAVFHYVQLRAFAHETEDAAKVKAALQRAAHDERVAFSETRADGSHGNRIMILEGDVKTSAAVKRLFATLQQDDPEGFARIAATARERVDDNLNFHFRLDKQEAYLGRLAVTNGDDAITVRGKIRSFESKRSGAGPERARSEVESFFLGLSGASERPMGQ